MLIDLISIVSFLGIAIAVYFSGSAAVQAKRDRLRSRLWGGVDQENPLSDAVLERLGNTDRNTPLDQEIRRAGWYRPTARRDFLSFRNTTVLFVMIICGVIAVGFGPGQRHLAARTVLVGIGGVILCWAIPRIYLRNVGNRRVMRIRRALPDALDLMSMCLTGGLSLTESFAHVSREIEFAYPDLSLELMIVKRQSELRSSDFAFDQFARRIDAPEIISLSSLITQGQRLGTDVVTSIREYADNIRLRRRQTADERSNKAGVKMLFPLTMCLLPSVFIILWGPSALELYTFLRGFQGASAQ
ncbi:MAG: type II secretion system F family protein [Pirellulaceae bacterium]|nr:type II secretion system F family protein [Planctomycetales bacterium]MCA9210931.1 type II secretion system F family protein [Planctomycetales bacterium]